MNPYKQATADKNEMLATIRYDRRRQRFNLLREAIEQAAREAEAAWRLEVALRQL